MNIKRTLVSAQRPEAKKAPLSRDQMKTGIAQEMERAHPNQAATKVSGSLLLEDLADLKGDDTDAMLKEQRFSVNRARSGETAARWTSYGAAAALVGSIGYAFTADSAQAVGTALKVAGGATGVYVASTLVQGVFDHVADGREEVLNRAENWTEFLQNKDQVPARPKLTTPISAEDFVAAAEAEATAPHPHKEMTKNDVTRLKAAFEDDYYAENAETLKTELSEAESQARTEKRLSYVQIAAGLGMTTGALVAGIGGYVGPLATLGLAAGGLAIAHTGVESGEGFKAQEQAAQGDLQRLENWTEYLSGQ